MMFKLKLWYDFRDRFIYGIPAAGSPDEKQRILEILNLVDKTDPKKRLKTKWDTRFRRVAPRIHKFEEALDIINKCGYLIDSYLDYIEDIHYSIELQLAVCKVRKIEFDGKYYARYSTLLFDFLRRWDLQPEVLLKIFREEKYEKVRATYNNVRHD